MDDSLVIGKMRQSIKSNEFSSTKILLKEEFADANTFFKREILRKKLCLEIRKHFQGYKWSSMLSNPKRQSKKEIREKLDTPGTSL